MIGGVNFQPGQGDPAAGVKKKPDQGVQEAVKVLSLRLPRVVGAQSIAPAPLLNAPGSGGNPRVDSVVNQVLGRMFPNGQQPSGAAAPMIPPRPVGPKPGESGTMPVSPPVRFEGVPRTPMMGDMMPDAPWAPPPGFAPRITVDNQLGQGDFTTGPGGASPPFDDGSNQPPASIAPGPDLGGAGSGANPFADLLDFLRRQQPAPTPSDISAPLV